MKINEEKKQKVGRPRKAGGLDPMYGFRAKPELMALIDHLVQSGDYSSRSEFILKAIEDKLKRYDKKLLTA